MPSQERAYWALTEKNSNVIQSLHIVAEYTRLKMVNCQIGYKVIIL